MTTYNHHTMVQIDGQIDGWPKTLCWLPMEKQKT